MIKGKSIFVKYFLLLFFTIESLTKTSGDKEIRTLDPLLARQVLSQLSYIPSVFFRINIFLIQWA